MNDYDNPVWELAILALICVAAFFKIISKGD